MIQQIKISKLEADIDDGVVVIIQPEIIKLKIQDTEELTKACKYKYHQALCCIEYIRDKYTSWDWLLNKDEKAEIIKEVVNQFNVSEFNVRKYIRIFLQSGLKTYALLPKFSDCGSRGKERKFIDTKCGPKGISTIVRDDEIIEIYKKMKESYLARGAEVTYIRLYEEMVLKYYCEKKYVDGEVIFIPFAQSLRPTFRGFKNWIKTHIDKSEHYINKNGKKRARNNIRALFSDTIAYLDVKAIGSRFEMDEMETDFYLVNRRDRSKVIGRAIVYFIIDVYSRSIVACDVGLDNNSWHGAELALLNMVESKKVYCEKYGIKIEEDKWPMRGALPSSIMVDNGAEYLSNNLFKLVQETGIGIDFTPPQMGSYKGNVEQKFRQMNILLKGNIPGEIKKDKYGQPHIKGARLDINELTCCVIEFILNYNKTPMDDYPETKEMFELGLVLTPRNIWNYSYGRYNELAEVNDIEIFKYSLMTKGVANITRNGIEYNGRSYICNDIKWLNKMMMNASTVNNKNLKLSIRFDNRNDNLIYFEKDGEINTAWLNCIEVINNDSEIQFPVDVKTNNSLYADLTVAEANEIYENKKLRRTNNAEERLYNNINSNQKLEIITNQAENLHKKANDKNNITENRSVEKTELHNERYLTINENFNNQTYNNQQNISINDSLDQIDVTKLTRLQKLKLIEQNYNISEEN